MSEKFLTRLSKHFDVLCEALFHDIEPGEELNVQLNAEDTLYLRFNGNRIRQNTSVEQVGLSLSLQSQGRSTEKTRTISGNFETDLVSMKELYREMRKEILVLPADPNQVPTTNNGRSEENFAGEWPTTEKLITEIGTLAEGTDLAGLFAGGAMIVANRNSMGQRHWFGTESYFLDYSIYDGTRAVKSVLAGSHWNRPEAEKNLARAKNQLSLQARPKITVKPGKYRTYLAPAAVSELVWLASWNGMSASAWKQGRNPFKKLAEGDAQLSKLFTLRENFGLGLTPRFNGNGELSPELLPLITEGRFEQFLTSSRTAKEYGLKPNGASLEESLRSPELMIGSLKEADILKEIGTGLYVSNLHYLNWSDPVTARMTGMTRYACFWVENGEIAGPIQDLRFDEGLLDVWGSKLIAITEHAEVDPSVATYMARSSGGRKTPGILVEDMTFTL